MFFGRPFGESFEESAHENGGGKTVETELEKGHARAARKRGLGPVSP